MQACCSASYSLALVSSWHAPIVNASTGVLSSMSSDANAGSEEFVQTCYTLRHSPYQTISTCVAWHWT